MIRVFVSYSHRDDDLRAELDTHLTMLRRRKVIDTWVDHQITAGDELDGAIRQELERADVILLLVSSYFLASEYCYAIEMERAMERHAAGAARVIPVILHPCDWAHAPFARLKVVPRDGKPVSTFNNRHEAFLQITTAIREAAERSKAPAASQEIPAMLPPTQPTETAPSAGAPPIRVRRRLTDRDRDLFVEQSFETIARYFEVSLAALESANPGIETRFRRPDNVSLTATVYADGDVVAECRIWCGTRGFEGGIQFSYDATSRGGFNEQLRIDDDDAELRLKPLGISMTPVNKVLTPDEAAAYYWNLLIARLQQHIRG
jgi:hypothetical protein